jgi:hypothetical protein
MPGGTCSILAPPSVFVSYTKGYRLSKQLSVIVNEHWMTSYSPVGKAPFGWFFFSDGVDIMDS